MAEVESTLAPTRDAGQGTEPMPAAAAPVMLGKPTLKERLATHFAAYGRIGLITYFAMSIATIIGFSIAIGAGVEPSSASGVFGVIGAGWLAAKATMPIRILITLAITPAIAAVLQRRKPTPA